MVSKQKRRIELASLVTLYRAEDSQVWTFDTVISEVPVGFAWEPSDRYRRSVHWRFISRAYEISLDLHGPRRSSSQHQLQ